MILHTQYPSSSPPPSHRRERLPSTNSSQSTTNTNRDSNLVRASVLDVALELGIGGFNSTVADWIFNNPAIDESEESVEDEGHESTAKADKSEDSHSSQQSAGAHNNTIQHTAKSHHIPPRIQTQLPSNNYNYQHGQYHILPPDSPFASSTVPVPFPRTAAPSSTSRYGLGFGLSLGNRSRSRSKVRAESDDDDSDIGRFKSKLKRKERGKKEMEAELVREAQLEAKAVKAKEKARKVEEKARRSEMKKNSKKARRGEELTEYDADGDVEAYHSEAHISKSKSKPKSNASDTEAKVKKSSSSFFRRKAKVSLREGERSPSPEVPPLPTLGGLGLGFSSSVASTSSIASTSGPGPSSTAGSGSGTASPNLTKHNLPPIAARFATTAATSPLPLPVSLPVSVPKEQEMDTQGLKSTSESQSIAERTRSPIPVSSSASTTPTPTREGDPNARDRDDTLSTTSSNSPSSSASSSSSQSSRRSQSHSSEISTPTSLPTSASTSTSTSTGSRSRGMFGFVGAGATGKETEREREVRKVKLSISLPLTRDMGPAATSPGGLPAPQARSKSTVPLFISREMSSPSPSTSSAASNTAPYHIPFPHFKHQTPASAPNNISQNNNNNNNNNRKPRPTFLSIQHPHEYNGAHHSPTLPSHPPNNNNHNSGERTRSPSPLRSPRRLHFPVAPPTPPPTGPLPNVPPLSIAGNVRRVRAPSTAPPSHAPPPIPEATVGIQRGRESPFPSRPSAENGKRDRERDVGELPSAFPPASVAPSGIQRGRELPFPRHPYGVAGAGLETFGAPRYRGLHPLGSSGVQSSGSPAQSNQREQEEDEDEDEGPLDPETIMNEFNLIRNRFNAHDRERFSAASVPVTEPDRYLDSFVSGGEGDSFSGQYQQLNSFSFSSEPVLDKEQEVKAGLETKEERREVEGEDDRSLYPDDEKSAGRRTMYLLEGRDSRHYDEFSRHSAVQSVYSVLDGDKSEEARERFVRRVTAMYGQGGREVVPPIPKLPDGLVIKETGVGRRRVDV